MYVGDFINIDEFNTWSYTSIPTTSKTFYDFTNATQGFEFSFSVQTISYDGTYSKPVIVKNSEVVSNSVNYKRKQIDSSTEKIWVAVSDVNKVGVSKVCYYKSTSTAMAETILNSGTEIPVDSDGYYSFTVTENGTYQIAAQYSDDSSTQLKASSLTISWLLAK